MIKQALVVGLLCSALSGVAAEYHWRGNGPARTADGASGAWTDAANWTDSKGLAVTDYPHLAEDIAVFHGVTFGAYVTISDSDVIDLAELRFAEGNTVLYCGLAAHVAVTKLTIADGAALEFVTNDKKAHWETDSFAVPADFTVGNRSEVLYAGTGAIRNALAHRNLNSYYGTRGLLTIGEDGRLTPRRPSSIVGDRGVGGDTVEESVEGLFVGDWGDYRGLSYEKWGGMSQAASFTLPSGLAVAVGKYNSFGKVTDAWQGPLDTRGAPLAVWGYATLTDAYECYVRVRLTATEFHQVSRATTVLFDDHTQDDVPLYRVIAGTLRLGGPVRKSDAESVDTTCAMNATTYEIGWDGTLAVACEGAVNADSTIRFASYNKNGVNFGSVNLAVDATVKKLIVDGTALDAGTYGAVGSGATTARDDLFAGAGVLTVLEGGAEEGEEGEGGGGEEGPLTEVDLSLIRVTELMASNESLATAAGEKGLDWIEIYNGTEKTVDFAGWLITDDPTKDLAKWKTIAGTALVGPGGYLLVWSDKDFAGWTDAEAHTTLGLSADGEAIGLATPDGSAIVSQFAFGPQFKDVSFGYADASDNLGFFKTATPGRANGTRVYTSALTPAVTFSVPHGYKTEPFTLELACDDPAAAIYYTTDGTSPTAETGLRYEAPITIAKTTVIRAAAVNSEAVLQLDASATYLFLDDILTADRETVPEGFPADKAVNEQSMRYGFRDWASFNPPHYMEDNAETERAHILRGFTNTISTISLVIDPKHLFDGETGIYVNAREDGRESERVTMVEQIDPVTGAANEFSTVAGLRIRGAASRSAGTPKHGFRLFFRSDYGTGALDFPLFGDEGADSFKKIDLRCSQNFSIANTSNWSDTYVHEVFSRDSQRDMGEPYARSRYYNLFINGVYWGLYQSEERGDENFAETYNGGKDSDYDVIKTSSEWKSGASQAQYKTDVNEGSREAWSNLWDITVHEGYASGTDAAANYNRVRGLNPDGTRNLDYPILVNPTNLIVYMSSSYYANDTDCPVKNGGSGNNVIAIRNRTDGKGARDGFFFLRHDTEWTFHAPNIGLNPESDPIADMRGIGVDDDWARNYYQFQPARLNAELLKNDDYRMTWSDVVYRHYLKKGGAMTAEKARARFQARMDEVTDAISCEMARWSIHASMCHGHWANWCNDAMGFMDKRVPYLIQHFRSYGWYPSVDAPVASLADGEELIDGVVLGEDATIVLAGTEAGTVYYTLDGTDPRLAGGAVNPSAIAYSSAIAPTGAVALRARVLTSAGEWSAMECLDLESNIIDLPDNLPPGKVITGVHNEAVVLSAGGDYVLYQAMLNGGVTITAAEPVVFHLVGVSTLATMTTGTGALTVDGDGSLAIAFTAQADGDRAVTLNGSYIQNGGTVSMDLFGDVQAFGFWCDTKGAVVELNGGTFTSTVAAGASSATFKLKKGSNDVTLNGTTVDVTLGGLSPRFVNTDGKIIVAGGRVNVVTAETGGADANVFKSVKAQTLSGGTVIAAATGAGSEIFSSDNKITVSGAVLSLEADDDCFSAQTNITVSAGIVHALSRSNDALDSNGSIVISGGSVFAFTLSSDHEALDVEPEVAGADNGLAHTLLITGGTVVAVGGANHVHAPDPGSVACLVEEKRSDSAKYVVLTGKSGSETIETSVNWNKRHAKAFSLLATAPGFAGSVMTTDDKATDVYPDAVKLHDDITGVFVRTFVGATTIAPGEDIVLAATTEEAALGEAAAYAIALSEADVAAGLIADVLTIAVEKIGEVYSARVVIDEDKVARPVFVSADEEAEPMSLERTAEGTALTLRVSNAVPGLWYGLAVAECPEGPFADDPATFSRAASAQVELTGSVRKTSAAFYRVRVRLIAP